MKKVLIIDDEPLARSLIIEYLQDFKELQVMAECNNGFEGLKAIQQFEPDLIFLDIQMPKINGFEMLELVEDPPAIIFTTAFDQYALQAFDKHAIDYLLKPFSKERFERAVRTWLGGQMIAAQKTSVEQFLQAHQDVQPSHERVVVKTNGKIKIIPVADILYLEAADDYVKIITGEGAYLKNKTLSFFEKALNVNQFVRCHRSYLIHVAEITRLEPYEKDQYLAILKTQARVPVSKTGYAKLKEVLGL